MKHQAAATRQSTGIPRLDQALGGGLIPGTLAVVMGATGIGKTQLGISYAFAGQQQEQETGILFDMTTRGDSQNQSEYAARMFGWNFRQRVSPEHFDPAIVWERDQIRADYLHAFNRSGRRVTIGDMQPEEWQEFKADLMRRLDRTIAFFYGNFVHGVRRCVIDGVEPTNKDSDSFQFHLFDYIYHQVLRKDHDWLARDLFRVHFRQQEPQVMAHPYDHQAIGSMLLYTSHEVLLDDLISRPIQSGDVLSNANTILLMGKTRTDGRMGRAIYVAKHRGSACEEAILPFQITEHGLEFDA
jgi:KaiC/GvpD/RAD55 family RecA-like ATPase